MDLDRAVLAFAGLVVLLSIALGVWVNPWWLAPGTFAGLNLLQSTFTGFCPAAMILKRLTVAEGAAFK